MMQGIVEWDQNEPMGKVRIRDLYEETARLEGVKYQGGYSVPVLYDTKKKLIVSNDSMDIAWMLAVDFAELHSV